MNIVSSGSQTATIGTKHQLYSTSQINTYVLSVDTYNMALGDVVELTIDIVCEPSGSNRQAYYAVFSHNQADPAKQSIAVVAPYGATFSLKQTAGTGRVFKWCVVAV